MTATPPPLDGNREHARTAGLLYLALVILGVLNLIVIPGQYSVPGDPAATVANIRTGDAAFRLGIVVGVLSNITYAVLGLALYRLLAPVGRASATLIVVFAAAGAGVGLVSAGAKLDVLTLLGTAPYLEPFTAEQIQAQAALSLRSYSNLTRLAELFWGLWLIPLGHLVYRSGFLPRVLGALLVAGGAGYALNFFGKVMIPGYATSSLPAILPIPAHFGEIGLMLWLVFVGTTPRKRTGPASPAATTPAGG